MSFVQQLRMRNMFPVNSNLGSAQVDLSGQDPMYEIINAYNQMQQQERLNRPRSGLEQVASRGKPIFEEQEPLKFGGVIGQQSNPGADILNRSKKSAEDLYASYGQPLNNQDVRGPSNDTIHLERYFARKDREKIADANLENARDKTRIAQQNADAKGWKTVTVTDPSDPSKQVNARINEVTGEVKPIELPGGGTIARPDSVEAQKKRVDLENEKIRRKQGIKDRAQSSLELLNQVLTNKDQLTDEATRAVGISGIGNAIPTTKGYVGNAKIDRLKNNLILDLIGEMKAQSKTGATGFGAMNLRELGVLEKAASMLDTGLDAVTFREQLKIIKEKLNKAMEDIPHGQIKVFPNGKRGKWDENEHAWEMIEE